MDPTPAEGDYAGGNLELRMIEHRTEVDSRAFFLAAPGRKPSACHAGNILSLGRVS
jgi:hypothetical protein